MFDNITKNNKARQISRLVNSLSKLTGLITDKFKVNKIFNEVEIRSSHDLQSLIKISNSMYKSVKSGNPIKPAIKNELEKLDSIVSRVVEDPIYTKEEYNEEKVKLNVNYLLQKNNHSELFQIRDQIRGDKHKNKVRSSKANLSISLIKQRQLNNLEKERELEIKRKKVLEQREKFRNKRKNTIMIRKERANSGNTKKNEIVNDLFSNKSSSANKKHTLNEISDVNINNSPLNIANNSNNISNNKSMNKEDTIGNALFKNSNSQYLKDIKKEETLFITNINEYTKSIERIKQRHREDINGEEYEEQEEDENYNTNKKFGSLESNNFNNNMTNKSSKKIKDTQSNYNNSVNEKKSYKEDEDLQLSKSNNKTQEIQFNKDDLVWKFKQDKSNLLNFKTSIKQEKKEEREVEEHININKLIACSQKYVKPKVKHDLMSDKSNVEVLMNNIISENHLSNNVANNNYNANNSIFSNSKLIPNKQHLKSINSISELENNDTNNLFSKNNINTNNLNVVSDINNNSNINNNYNNSYKNNLTNPTQASLPNKNISSLNEIVQKHFHSIKQLKELNNPEIINKPIVNTDDEDQIVPIQVPKNNTISVVRKEIINFIETNDKLDNKRKLIDQITAPEKKILSIDDIERKVARENITNQNKLLALKLNKTKKNRSKNTTFANHKNKHNKSNSVSDNNESVHSNNRNKTNYLLNDEGDSEEEALEKEKKKDTNLFVAQQKKYRVPHLFNDPYTKSDNYINNKIKEFNRLIGTGLYDKIQLNEKVNDFAYKMIQDKIREEERIKNLPLPKKLYHRFNFDKKKWMDMRNSTLGLYGNPNNVSSTLLNLQAKERSSKWNLYEHLINEPDKLKYSFGSEDERNVVRRLVENNEVKINAEEEKKIEEQYFKRFEELVILREIEKRKIAEEAQKKNLLYLENIEKISDKSFNNNEKASYYSRQNKNNESINSNKDEFTSYFETKLKETRENNINSGMKNEIIITPESIYKNNNGETTSPIELYTNKVIVDSIKDPNNKDSIKKNDMQLNIVKALHDMEEDSRNNSNSNNLLSYRSQRKSKLASLMQKSSNSIVKDLKNDILKTKASPRGISIYKLGNTNNIKSICGNNNSLNIDLGVY